MVFETLIALPNMITGVWRRFGIHVFEGRLTVDDMDRIAAQGDAWRRKNPGDCVEMVVILPSDNRMTSEERGKAASLIKRWEHKRSASATVVLATGLVGAAGRSVLTGLQLLAPPPHPTKVFGRTRDAVDWLQPHVEVLCGPDATRDALRAGVDDLLARFRKTGGA